MAARHRGARLCIPPPARGMVRGPRKQRDTPIAPPLPTRITQAARWGHRALPPLLTRSAHSVRSPLMTNPWAPYRHYAREVRTAITSAKYAPPLSRVAPAPTGATCEKERTSTRMPALVVYRKPCPLDYERRMSASLDNAARYASTSASGARATPSFIAASATAVATVGRSMSSKGFGMM